MKIKKYLLKVILLLTFILISFNSCNRIDTSSPDKMLISSAKVGNIDYVKLAIAKGANLNAKDEKGSTALHWASYYGYKNIVKLLLLQGANPYEVDNYGLTPFDVAKINKKKEVLKIFKSYFKGDLKKY